MTPTVTDLLNGCIQTLAAPPRAGRRRAVRRRAIGLVAMMNRLIALEMRRRCGAYACGRTPRSAR